MQELSVWQNIIVFFLMGLVLLYMFWWWGGFSILRWLLKKKLARQAANPAKTVRIDSLTDAWKARIASGHQSVETYFAAQNISADDQWPEQAFENYPDSRLATYFYAQKLLRLAWQARGTGPAKNVSNEALYTMLNHLDHAERLIDGAIEDAPVPGDFLLQLLDIDLLRGRRKQASQRVRNYQRALNLRLDVYFKELKTIYPRWGGSHEQLLARAREIAAQGSLHCAAEAYAWCHFAEDNTPRALRKTLQGEPLDALVKKYQQLPATPTQIKSYEDYMTLLAHRTFAALFIHLDKKTLARQALRATSGHIDDEDYVDPYRKDLSLLGAAAKFAIVSFRRA